MGNLCGGIKDDKRPMWTEKDKMKMKKSLSKDEYNYFYDPKLQKSRIVKLNVRQGRGDFHNFASLEQITREHVTTRYEFQKTLGEGAFGKVKVAALKQNRQKLFAIKSIPRSMIEVPEDKKNNN